MSRKTIYLTRHGQTDYNQRMIVQGSGIDSDLNDKGREQAQKFYGHFQHIPFDAFFVSELKRTHQTLAPFFEKKRAPIILPELNEISWGILEGKEPSPERYQQFLEISEQWKQGNYHVAIEGGESPQAMFNRQKRGLQTLMQQPFETALVYMHGRAMRSFLCLLTNTPLCDMDQFPHENTGLYILEQEKDMQFNITTYNYTDHLK